MFEVAVEAVEHWPPELPATIVLRSVRRSASTPPPRMRELPAIVALTNNAVVPLPVQTPPPDPFVTALPVIVEFATAKMASLALQSPPP